MSDTTKTLSPLTAGSLPTINETAARMGLFGFAARYDYPPRMTPAQVEVSSRHHVEALIARRVKQHRRLDNWFKAQKQDVLAASLARMDQRFAEGIPYPDDLYPEPPVSSESLQT